jgi:hypothetical protein
MFKKTFAALATSAVALTAGGVAHADPAPKTVASLGADAPSTGGAVQPDTTSSPSEGTRIRGGFSLNGGVAAGIASGPAFSLGLRLGAQFGRYFGVYYQQSPMLFLASNGSGNGGAAAFLDMNSVLASLTLADIFEIGAGPSLDYYAAAAAGCDATVVNCSTATASGWQLGMHGRLALTLGGRDATTGRRSGFSIGLDEHPMFADGQVLALTTLGVGGEWY